jgi:hypothetical protein
MPHPHANIRPRSDLADAPGCESPPPGPVTARQCWTVAAGALSGSTYHRL